VTGETLTPIDKFAAPYSREIRLHDVVFESGMRLMRVTIKEGRRITILDVDAETAARWGGAMTAWSKAAKP
jgi:hypothetical protein